MNPTPPDKENQNHSTLSPSSTSTLTQTSPRLPPFLSPLLLSPSFLPFLSGLTAGLSSTLITQPFDIIKTRQQVHRDVSTGRSLSAENVMRNLIKTHPYKKGISSLFVGWKVNAIGNAIGWGSYFFLFNYIKNISLSQSSLSPYVSDIFRNSSLLSASISGVIVLAITNPLWVLKTRCFLDDSAENEWNKNSIRKSILNIYQKEGRGGLYKGFTASLMGTGHGAIQLTVYDHYRKWKEQKKYNPNHNINTSNNINNNISPPPITFSSLDIIEMSIVSKSIASLLFYPLQVIRSRLQAEKNDININTNNTIKSSSSSSVTSSAPLIQHQHYTSTWDCVTKMVKFEGWASLYRGVAINTLKQLPAACVVFIVYENTQVMGKKWQREWGEKGMQ